MKEIELLKRQKYSWLFLTGLDSSPQSLCSTLPVQILCYPFRKPCNLRFVVNYVFFLFVCRKGHELSRPSLRRFSYQSCSPLSILLCSHFTPVLAVSPVSKICIYCSIALTHALCGDNDCSRYDRVPAVSHTLEEITINPPFIEMPLTSGEKKRDQG